MSKYNARKVSYDGHTFDSIHERNVYERLKELEGKGEIQDLKTQPRFELIPTFRRRGRTIRKAEYVADFMFIEDGRIIVVDAKSKATEKDKLYRLKRKSFLFKYGDSVIFREIFADGRVVTY